MVCGVMGNGFKLGLLLARSAVGGFVALDLGFHLFDSLAGCLVLDGFALDT